MPSIVIRPFQRADRDQLTALANAHAAAVIPGVSISVNTMLSHLEREPGEFLVDPWVTARMTLVAEQRHRIVAAAHLLRYDHEDRVSESYRDAGEIRWFICWPESSIWPDSIQAGDVLIGACVRQLVQWGVTRQYADGALPAPGVYGVPEQWPHVRAAYERAGFLHEGHTELIYLAEIDDLRHAPGASVAGLTARRSVGSSGTRLTALLADQEVGYIEVETLQEPAMLPRNGGWADVGNLHVREEHKDTGVARWLVAQAAEWLRLAGVGRVLDYAWPEQAGRIAFLETVGFKELTRTERGWARQTARP